MLKKICEGISVKTLIIENVFVKNSTIKYGNEKINSLEPIDIYSVELVLFRNTKKHKPLLNNKIIIFPKHSLSILQRFT